MFAGTQTGPPGTSEGIYAYNWNPKDGTLASLGLAAKTPNPTFLAFTPDHKVLIAANEIENFAGTGPGQAGTAQGQAQAADQGVAKAGAVKTGAVSSFAVDGSRLTLVNSVAAEGAGTCHVSVDQAGQAVFAANYTGGSAASFRLDSAGHLSAAVSEFHYQGHGPNAERQEAPHAHRVTVSPENRFLFVNDLGLDCIHIYHLDWATAKLTPAVPSEWKAEPGSGPRVLRFHPTGRWAYCVNEITCTIDVLGWNAATGQLTSLQKIKLAAQDFKGTATASELVFDRAGKFGYAAVRGSDFVATLAVDESTGKLTMIDHGQCGGKTPRHMALDPTERWLLVANQDSDVISAIPRDPKTGRLAPTGINTALSKPQCLLFA